MLTSSDVSVVSVSSVLLCLTATAGLCYVLACIMGKSGAKSASGALTAHGARLVSIYHKTLAKTSFARCLGSHDASIESLTLRTSAFRFTVPPRLCIDSRLSASSAMAIFDDLSTVHLLGIDTSCRGGVSVHLSTTLLRRVPVGTDLTLRCTVDKLGKSMGFVTMEMVDSASSAVVATGKHVKFMPTGNYWVDLLSRPFLLAPLIKHCLYDDGSTLFHRLGLLKPSRPKEYNCGEGPAAVYDYLGLAPADNTLKLKVHGLISNPLGSMHGGAVGMAAEWAALQSPDGKAKTGMGQVVTSISATYLSALTGEAAFDAAPGAALVVARKMQGSAAPCSQFVMAWGAL